MDVACGLNPLAWSWMPFDVGVSYLAYDIYTDMIHFIQDFITLAGINGRAEIRDVLFDPPTGPVDLAFILKSLPCLEQINKMAASTLFEAIRARYLIVSYPVASLGGQKKGMLENYDAHFRRLATGRRWSVKSFEFSTELAFLVETNFIEAKG